MVIGCPPLRPGTSSTHLQSFVAANVTARPGIVKRSRTEQGDRTGAGSPRCDSYSCDEHAKRAQHVLRGVRGRLVADGLRTSRSLVCRWPLVDLRDQVVGVRRGCRPEPSLVPRRSPALGVSLPDRR